MDSALGTCGRREWTRALSVRDHKATGRRRDVLLELVFGHVRYWDVVLRVMFIAPANVR